MALNRRRFSQMMEGLRNLLIRATSVVYFLFMIAAFAITINAGWNLPSWMQGLTGGAILAFAILTILLKIALDRLIAWLTPSLGKHQRMDDQGGLHMI
jgi:membrane protein implicated in regulation of membrane protease activity